MGLASGAGEALALAPGQALSLIDEALKLRKPKPKKGTWDDLVRILAAVG